MIDKSIFTEGISAVSREVKFEFSGSFKLSDIEYELLSIDPRIRVIPIPVDYLEKKTDVAYIPRKDMLIFAIGVPSAAHEIAHMVEMNYKHRLVLDDWGLPSSSEFFKQAGLATYGAIIESHKPQYSAFAAIARECKVAAIQDHLYKEKRNQTLVKYNIIWADVAKQNVPLKMFKTYDDVVAWAEALYDKTYEQWSLERIRCEWKTRLDYIRDWTAIEFDYHGEEDESKEKTDPKRYGEFMCDNMIRTKMGRLDR